MSSRSISTHKIKGFDRNNELKKKKKKDFSEKEVYKLFGSF